MVHPKIDAVFGFEFSSQFICDNAFMTCWSNREHTEDGASLCRVEEMLCNIWVQEVKDRKYNVFYFDIWPMH